ncbi:hypothetical protein RB595_004118 [Gaeumannomyces hyphopodioides]
MKKIIVCCDGTSKTGFKDGAPTNVWRISRCIRASEAGTPQVLLYQPGIGTGAESRWFTNLLDQAFGTGIDEKILEAYNFICHNYETSNDKIILIGFSRGAFIMRCVADLIHKVGLLTKKGLTYLPAVFKEWRAGHQSPLLQPWVGNESRRSWVQYLSSFWPWGRAQGPPASNRNTRTLGAELGGELEENLRRNIGVEVCALWDTVSSIGTPWPALFRLPTSTSLTFVHSDLNGIENAFQALALHETRWNFPPIVWRNPGGSGETSLEQCWFMGYHSDIGGGRKCDALAHIALTWMFARLAGHLHLDQSAIREPSFTDGSSWRISPEGRLMLRIRSSMTTGFRLMGSKIRMPRSQFWNGEGPDDINPVQQQNDVSWERMHRTVRLHKIAGMPEPAAALDGCTRPVEIGGDWQLRRAEDPREFPVPEARMEEPERVVLTQWLDVELEHLQLHAILGQLPPETIIANIKSKLRLGLEANNRP